MLSASAARIPHAPKQTGQSFGPDALSPPQRELGQTSHTPECDNTQVEERFLEWVSINQQLSQLD
ncbi:hypothetical protein PGT21_036753 [Puccinia graminis f. sp. tritici]|uniref:Uncharacterized protein n=1 Tax=Puccinia graminis f. sp. tritici TaxID=56615 RepID=A0A5B0P418_PUCGR|nr:hypothetical protein PGT21_036753 [Puccinia graminis f. sp. tritici]